MRTTNQKIVFSWILYFTDILRNPRGRSDPPQAENPVKQDSFLYIYRDTKNDEKLR